MTILPAWWPARWRARTYRNDRLRIVMTEALGPVTIPTGFEWQVGAWPFVLPDALVSEALAKAAAVHDIAYAGPWTAPHLHRADRALIEVFCRKGGSPWLVPVIWAAVRVWAWTTLKWRAS